MRLCCADGEKCDIHNAFPIRGCHAWTHLATCQREMDRTRMRINGVLVVERGRNGCQVNYNSARRKRTERGVKFERKGITCSWERLRRGFLRAVGHSVQLFM